MNEEEAIFIQFAGLIQPVAQYPGEEERTFIGGKLAHGFPEQAFPTAEPVPQFAHGQ